LELLLLFHKTVLVSLYWLLYLRINLPRRLSPATLWSPSLLMMIARLLILLRRSLCILHVLILVSMTLALSLLQKPRSVSLHFLPYLRAMLAVAQALSRVRVGRPTFLR